MPFIFTSECTEIRLAAGLCLDPLWELTAHRRPSRPIAGFKWQGYGPRGSDWTEEKGKEERDRRGGKRETE